MDIITILTLATGAGQLLFAFLAWVGWDKKFMTGKILLFLKQRVRLVPILLLGGFLFAGLGFYRAFTFTCSDPFAFRSGQLIEVRDRKFMNERVPLDGHQYIGCEFTNVTFVYNGTAPVGLQHNKIYGSIGVYTESDAVFSTFALLKGLDALKTDVPVLGPNMEPVEQVKPLERR